MTLSHLSDEALHLETKELFSKERKLLTTIIQYLRENERRRLYSTFKYESLQEYLMYEFGCSEDQAWRRVDAIRLLEDLPELQEKLNQGLHCLTNLNLVNALFKKEAEHGSEFSRKEKLAILDAIEQLPTRKVKRMLLGYSSVPQELAEDRKHQFTVDEFENDEELQAKFKILKGLLAHSDPNLSTLALVKKLCDLGIKEWDPSKKVKRSTSAAPRKISKALKYRAVWENAKSCCENCGSTYALQIEHIVPRALGGTDDPENLKLLCRSCNQRTAIEVFGTKKMEKYFSLATRRRSSPP